MIRQKTSLFDGNRTKSAMIYQSPKQGGRIVFSMNATKVEGYADLMGFKDSTIDRNDTESSTVPENKKSCFDFHHSEDFRFADKTCGHDTHLVPDEGHIRIPRKLQGTVAEVVGLYPKQPKSALKASSQLERDQVRFGHWSDSMVPPLNKQQTSSYHRDCRTLGIIRGGGNGVPDLRATPVRSVTFLSDTETCSTYSR
ncbi:hypothetical protein KP79_PYT07444 [Mizuhopecten yessoensis]|uniref:Uncharacterized protein n=1 Tax=Mizuhopecten yessoensis TaxID=6573 RepID=A0A210PM71_MIZYE|nr:hypothetical protein KP79_PYT07444 [Mizuhopecten yessoensis]